MKKVLLASALYVLPMLAFAQTGGNLGGIRNLVTSVGGIINILIPIAAALALLFFFWGLAMFILAIGRGDDDGRKRGKDTMIWGIVALFVMVSVWGLTRFISSALLGTATSTSSSGQIPTIDNLPR